MREITFLKEQSGKWQEFEKLLNEKNANPQKLAGLFIEVTDDLSYARTHYPASKTTQYINGLAARVHQEIYKNKKENRGRFISFWKTEVPLVMGNYRNQLYLSFFYLPYLLYWVLYLNCMTRILHVLYWAMGMWMLLLNVLKREIL